MTVISLALPKQNAPTREVRLIPGNGFAEAKRVRHRAPPVLSCTTRGFSCPAGCPAGGGLLPRLFTLTREQNLGLAPAAASGGLFSVTLSVTGPFRNPPPHVLCGVLSVGVRTFLWQTPWETPKACQRPSATRCAPKGSPLLDGRKSASRISAGI